VKKPDHLINYHFSNPFIVENVKINNINFHIPTLIKEVQQSSKKKVKEFQKTVKTFLMTASSFLMFPLSSMANTLPTNTSTNLPKTAEGIPPELMALMITLLTIAVGGAVFIAAIMLAVTGIGKMFRVKGITQWTTDILKGLIQSLVAVPVVFIVYYLANLLFKGNGWHVIPF
jgi:hypothetical protein